MALREAGLEQFYSVIPAGGIGSRLWPLSRADAPKFLHDLTGSGTSLLRDAWDRLVPISGPDRVMVVTGRAHRAAVEAQLPELVDRERRAGERAQGFDGRDRAGGGDSAPSGSRT